MGVFNWPRRHNTNRRKLRSRRYQRCAGKRRQNPFGLSVYYRRLRLEPLEDRRLLSADSGQLDLFRVSPALFVENQGQWADASISYMHQGDGVNVAMTDTGPVFQVSGSVRETPQDLAEADLSAPDAGKGPGESASSIVFSAAFVGANLVQPVGAELAEARFNYFVGPQENWHSDVPGYQKVVYSGLYEGVDLHTWGLRTHLKYEFHVAPGADYSQIQVRYAGIEGLSLAEDGSLVVDLGEGWDVVVDDAPYIYQVIDGQQVEIAGHFVLIDDLSYTFQITGGYDPHQSLVIDPDLAWSTYLGGSGDDYGYGIAVDAAGNAYVAGTTISANFPTTAGAFDPTYNGASDVFVAKLNASGSGLAYSTYLGGSGDDGARGSGVYQNIAVDTAGNTYVAGYTASADFPTTTGALDRTFTGGDAFVAKLNPTGSGLIYSTYLGGTNQDATFGCFIAVDRGGSAYVTGTTLSTDFPTTAGAFDTTYNGSYDTFVAKLNPAGSGLVYATYLGGSGSEAGEGIAVDATGDAYVAGWTRQSANFPTSAGALDTTINGGGNYDAFVAKFNSTGSALVYSTYLGGSDWNIGCGIAVDAAGNAYVTGHTWSTDFPATAGAFDTTFNGSTEAFVAKLNPAGSGLVYATYLGGSSADCGYGIAVDAAGNAYVTGETSSTDFPTTAGAFDTTISNHRQSRWYEEGP